MCYRLRPYLKSTIEEEKNGEGGKVTILNIAKDGQKTRRHTGKEGSLSSAASSACLLLAVVLKIHFVNHLDDEMRTSASGSSQEVTPHNEGEIEEQKRVVHPNNPGQPRKGEVKEKNPSSVQENFQNPSLSEPAADEQLSVALVSSTPSLIKRVCNYTLASAPAVSSAWLLPLGSQQLLPESVYHYQQAGTNIPGFPNQSHLSTSAASSGAFEWQLIRSGEGSSSLGDVTVTIINQNTSVSSMSIPAGYSEISHANAIIPWYPTLPARLVQETTSLPGPHQSLPYQEDSQVYYYDPNTLGPLLCGELGPSLQSYDSGSHAGGGAYAPPTDIMMMLKDSHPQSVPPAVPTSGIYPSAPVQCFQVIDASQETDTSLGIGTSQGFQACCQTFCLPQTAELKSCTQVLESNTPPKSRDISIISPIQSPSSFLALPLAPSQEQTVNKTVDEVKDELSKLLEVHQNSKDNEEAPLLSLKIQNFCDIIPPISPVSQGNTPGSKNTNLGESSLSLKDQRALEDGLAPATLSADLSTLVEDVFLPQLFSPLTDLDLFEISTPAHTKDAGAIEVQEVQEKPPAVKALPNLLGNNEESVSEPMDGDPKVKIQRLDPQCLVEGEVVVGSTLTRDRAPDITAKNANCRTQKAASSKLRKAKGPGKEKTKRPRGKEARKCEEQKKPGSKVKAEEKPAIAKAKRRDRPPELSQEAFKKPRSSLGMHMLESVQVFHALGKKREQKAPVSSSWALGNTSNTEFRQSRLHPPQKETGPEKTQGKDQKPEASADAERPPPGKVKLVPLPFLRLDKSQASSVPRKLRKPMVSHRALAPVPARPPSKSAQPPEVNPSQAAPARTSLKGAIKPAGPVSTILDRSGFNNPTQRRVSQSAAPRPVPYKISSCTSLHREPVSTAPPKPHSPPMARTQYLLEDFSRQPIPWRKVYFPGPVVSTPISDEQRPEREAMKRQAQLQRKNAANCSALGKVQLLMQREKDMQISRYYGYVM